MQQKNRDLKESDSRDGSGGGGGGGVKDVTETSSLSSQDSARPAADHLVKLHCAFLEVVFNLSSDVSLRKNTTALNV